MSVLSDFEVDVFHALADTYGSSDAHDALCLRSLLEPFQQPFECDSHKIGLWKTVLFLASYAGPSDIELAHLVAAHKKLGRLENHVCEEHRSELEAIPSLRRSFQEQHLYWIDSENILRCLPGLRGKSLEETARYLKQQWDELERCQKCHNILICEDLERGHGICFKCEPPGVEAAC